MSIHRPAGGRSGITTKQPNEKYTFTPDETPSEPSQKQNDFSSPPYSPSSPARVTKSVGSHENTNVALNGDAIALRFALPILEAWPSDLSLHHSRLRYGSQKTPQLGLRAPVHFPRANNDVYASVVLLERWALLVQHAA